MGAYRCSTCGINYAMPVCEKCGGSVWWGSDLEPTEDTEAEKEAAVREQLAKHTNEWADPVDKTVNWRFEQLYKAGYHLKACQELAGNRSVELHGAIALAEELGAETAYLRYF